MINSSRMSTPITSFVTSSHPVIKSYQITSEDYFCSVHKKNKLLFKGGSDDVWEAVKEKSPIPRSLTLLGSGVESHVYKVSDNFVFRVPRDLEGTHWNLSRNNLADVSDDKRELRNINNIGKPVAKMYASGKPIFFHKLMPGVKASITYNHLNLDGSIPYNQRAAFINRYSDYLKRISSFPQSSYKEFLWAVHQLDKAGYAIDPGANNLLIDNQKKQFSIVDYKETERAQKKGMFPINEQNNIAYQMAMLLDMQFKIKIRGNSEGTSDEKKLCREILKKTLCAAAELKYTNHASTKLPDTSTFHLRHINDKSCNSFTPQQIFEACGLTASNWSEIRLALKEQEKGSFSDYLKVKEIIENNIED